MDGGIGGVVAEWQYAGDERICGMGRYMDGGIGGRFAVYC